MIVDGAYLSGGGVIAWPGGATVDGIAADVPLPSMHSGGVGVRTPSFPLRTITPELQHASGGSSAAVRISQEASGQKSIASHIKSLGVVARVEPNNAGIKASRSGSSPGVNADTSGGGFGTDPETLLALYAAPQRVWIRLKPAA